MSFTRGTKEDVYENSSIPAMRNNLGLCDNSLITERLEYGVLSRFYDTLDLCTNSNIGSREFSLRDKFGSDVMGRCSLIAIASIFLLIRPVIASYYSFKYGHGGLIVKEFMYCSPRH